MQQLSAPMLHACPGPHVIQVDLALAILLQRADVVWSRDEIVSAVVRPLTGIAVVLLVYQFVRRVPWPRPFRARFVAVHLLAAPFFAALWALSSRLVELLVAGGPFPGRLMRSWDESLAIGMFFYLIVAGVSYAVESSARAARAESLAARTQLAALRAQIHPHFLFNALHTVVQLIPADPARAADAAELVAALLRTTLEEQRDEVSLGDEWRFVSRYLALERIRFGERLVVHESIAPSLLEARVPAFALQTLVENAVQHGAAPRVAPTDVFVTAGSSRSSLTLSVRNATDADVVRSGPRSGAGTPTGIGTAPGTGTGTGLARLRERLAALYGDAARLDCGPTADGGYEAVLVVPHRGGRDA